MDTASQQSSTGDGYADCTTRVLDLVKSKSDGCATSRRPSYLAAPAQFIKVEVYFYAHSERAAATHYRRENGAREPNLAWCGGGAARTHLCTPDAAGGASMTYTPRPACRSPRGDHLVNFPTNPAKIVAVRRGGERRSRGRCGRAAGRVQPAGRGRPSSSQSSQFTRVALVYERGCRTHRVPCSSCDVSVWSAWCWCGICLRCEASDGRTPVPARQRR
ncbi:hypothetical protein EVAR_43954_1 [Eumeta japonica]|uniref:Uncharacterized protein n=1 Tax=Eumeta variegata TaxID=151549 RepID=A0A4C1XZR0_EUMVA|nr:hypothetical protein EVAR_43954_1 [Eumeta japonica]